MKTYNGVVKINLLPEDRHTRNLRMRVAGLLPIQQKPFEDFPNGKPNEVDTPSNGFAPEKDYEKMSKDGMTPAEIGAMEVVQGMSYNPDNCPACVDEAVDCVAEHYEQATGGRSYKGRGFVAKTALLTVAAFALQMFSWGAGDIPSSHQSQNIDTGKATHLVYGGNGCGGGSGNGGSGDPFNPNYSGVRVAFGSEDSGNPYPNGGPGAGDQGGQSGPRDTDINIGSVVAGLFNAIGPGVAHAGEPGPYSGDRQAFDYEAQLTGEAEEHFDRAIPCVQSRDWECAAAEYRISSELAPNNPVTFASLGTALRFAGRLDDALEAYSMSVQIDPGYIEGYLGLGLTNNMLGNADKAKENITTYLRLAPDTPHRDLCNEILAK